MSSSHIYKTLSSNPELSKLNVLQYVARYGMTYGYPEHPNAVKYLEMLRPDSHEEFHGAGYHYGIDWNKDINGHLTNQTIFERKRDVLAFQSKEWIHFYGKEYLANVDIKYLHYNIHTYESEKLEPRVCILQSPKISFCKKSDVHANILIIAPDHNGKIPSLYVEDGARLSLKKGGSIWVPVGIDFKELDKLCTSGHNIRFYKEGALDNMSIIDVVAVEASSAHNNHDVIKCDALDWGVNQTITERLISALEESSNKNVLIKGIEGLQSQLQSLVSYISPSVDTKKQFEYNNPATDSNITAPKSSNKPKKSEKFESINKNFYVNKKFNSGSKTIDILESQIKPGVAMDHLKKDLYFGRNSIAFINKDLNLDHHSLRCGSAVIGHSASNKSYKIYSGYGAKLDLDNLWVTKDFNFDLLSGIKGKIGKIYICDPKIFDPSQKTFEELYDIQHNRVDVYAKYVSSKAFKCYDVEGCAPKDVKNTIDTLLEALKGIDNSNDIKPNHDDTKEFADAIGLAAKLAIVGFTTAIEQEAREAERARVESARRASKKKKITPKTEISVEDPTVVINVYDHDINCVEGSAVPTISDPRFAQTAADASYGAYPREEYYNNDYNISGYSPEYNEYDPYAPSAPQDHNHIYDPSPRAPEYVAPIVPDYIPPSAYGIPTSSGPAETMKLADFFERHYDRFASNNYVPYGSSKQYSGINFVDEGKYCVLRQDGTFKMNQDLFLGSGSIFFVQNSFDCAAHCISVESIFICAYAMVGSPRFFASGSNRFVSNVNAEHLWVTESGLSSLNIENGRIGKVYVYNPDLFKFMDSSISEIQAIQNGEFSWHVEIGAIKIYDVNCPMSQISEKIEDIESVNILSAYLNERNGGVDPEPSHPSHYEGGPLYPDLGGGASGGGAGGSFDGGSGGGSGYGGGSNDVLAP